MTLLCKRLSPSTSTQQLRVPDHNDWARLYPEIEHLYIRKRYKLRYIMQHIERKYRLKASEQMYKKRFAQWDLQKNSRRSSLSKSDSEFLERKRRKIVQINPRQCKKTESISPSPSLSKRDRLMITMLKSVKTWSTSYFELWDSRKGRCLSTGQDPFTHRTHPQVVNDFVFALKLVDNLLGRGHGQLAGRVTRKAFLMLENTITLDDPALIWNLLELMHYMITLRQERLCEMLLIFLSALVDCKMTKSHPLSTMLHTMDELLTTHRTLGGETSDLSSRSTDASPASSTDSFFVSGENHPLCMLLDLLRQSWAVNAGIIFKHLDIGFFELYCNIDWDLCSLGLPAAELNAARQWFNRIEAQREQNVPTPTPKEEMRCVDIDCGIDEDCKFPPALHMGNELAEQFGKLREDSIGALRRDWDAIIHKSIQFNGDNTIPIRILAGLVSANVLQWPTTIECSDAASIGSPEMLRIHAGYIAGAIRTLLDRKRNECIQEHVHGPSVIESIRTAIALCEYAYGKTDPRVVRELWSLQDAFLVAGDCDQARQTEKEALCRLNKYVYDIPPDLA